MHAMSWCTFLFMKLDAGFRRRWLMDSGKKFAKINGKPPYIAIACCYDTCVLWALEDLLVFFLAFFFLLGRISKYRPHSILLL